MKDTLIFLYIAGDKKINLIAFANNEYRRRNILIGDEIFYMLLSNINRFPLNFNNISSNTKNFILKYSR